MVLTVTEPAREKILELRAQEDDPESLGLRIEVTGVQGVEYTYDLTFDRVSSADEAAGDVVEHQGDLPVIVPVDSVDALRGATLDLPKTGGQAGLVLRNPNRPDPLSAGKIELTGSIEDKVRQLLDGRINPALAMHGGFAQLDRVEGDKVFVTMGGGCQGCAVSAMTLREGIARAITEAIPEVSEVVDVTDHSLGENPYYT
ncbi:MAG TPA: NifU family protein [Acidimicrobiales bacterium]|jgi:Fe/S biogenesis protein NfuA|nr:NifU family protein [Acidimicrobiales bacterium]